jgi:serine/threonine protein kinase
MRQFKIGEFIEGEYLVRAVLGGEHRSGMGVVYVVEEKTTREPFVLKTYQIKTGQAAAKAFLKEAESWIQIGVHPNIVRCHWLKALKQQLFVAAEYVWPDEDNRNTLTHYISSQKLPLRAQLRWAAQFCYGMRHALKRGCIAHRDVKPDNLMVDRYGSIKITDFGLVKFQFEQQLENSKSAGSQRLFNQNATAMGAVMGTPPFMAPEQFVDSGSVDHRADIYSFGIVMFMMASGGSLPIAPARVPSSEQTAWQAWAHMHMTKQPREVDSPLMAIIAICLEKDRSKRFASFDDFLEALAVVAKRHDILLPQEEHLEDAEHDSLYAVAQSMVALGRHEDALHILTGITRRWPNSSVAFTELGRLWLVNKKPEKAEHVLRESLHIYSESSAAWNNLATALVQQGRVKEARGALGRAIKIDPENTGAMSSLASLLITDGDLKEAKALCDLALFWRPEKVMVLQAATQCYMRMGLTLEATPLLQRLVDNNPQDHVAWFNLALCYKQQRKAPAYIEVVKKVVSLQPDDLQAANLLLQALAEEGRIDEAISICEDLEQKPKLEVFARCKRAQMHNLKGELMAAYLALKKGTDRYPRDGALWFTMAVVLHHNTKYREEALTAAQNAKLCWRESGHPVTPGDRQFLEKMISDLTK